MRMYMRNDLRSEDRAISSAAATAQIIETEDGVDIITEDGVEITTE